MILEEPRVEFVSIDLKDAIVTSGGAGGGQYCIASMEDAEYCPGWIDNVDWGSPMN